MPTYADTANTANSCQHESVLSLAKNGIQTQVGWDEEFQNPDDTIGSFVGQTSTGILCPPVTNASSSEIPVVMGFHTHSLSLSQS